jgi:hypothetical protein
VGPLVNHEARELSRIFVGLNPFESAWRLLGLTDMDRRALELELLENPKAGVLLSGTNGVRKIRRPYKGSGKSGGIRVFYYDYEKLSRIYLLAVIKKGTKENLSKSERNQLGEMIAAMKKGKDE